MLVHTAAHSTAEHTALHSTELQPLTHRASLLRSAVVPPSVCGEWSVSECRRHCAVRLVELRAISARCASWLSAGGMEVECVLCGQSFEWQLLAGETVRRAITNVPEYE